jgi:RNA recognition motif-containing protein
MAAAIETKLYVTNFPSSATRQQLQQFFSRFGRVQECAIMWNSYAFVHYATMEEARRALDQSNGAMFLNRKLIVQLSTSRFRPQPKETNNSLSQPPKQLMVMPTYHHHLTNGGGGGSTLHHQQQQQQPNTLTQPYPNEVNYDMMTSYNSHPTLSSPSPIPDGNNFYTNTYRPPSPFYLSQEMNNGYYPQYPNLPLDRMTSSPLSLQTNKINPIKLNKNIKTDTGTNGEIPKLYCTNLPDNCKANDLQHLFSPFGHVIDCVILWDYYAFVTFKTFSEAERALHALHGYIWKDRRLIVEWSRASGRRQQQQTSPSPTTPRLGSFGCMFNSIVLY